MMREFARERIAVRLRKVGSQLERVDRDPGDEDAVHDLRVAIRRAWQALRLFAELVGEGESKRLREALRGVLKCAGEVRNCDVARELAASAGFGESGGVAQALGEVRAGHEAALRVAVKRALGVDLSPRWDKEAKPERWNPAQPVDENARRELPRRAAKFLKEGAVAAREETSWENLHEFRLSAKRFRYTLELFEDVYGPALAARLKAMRRVQESLGEINDCETMLAMECVRGNEKLTAWLEERRREKRAEFGEAWSKEFGGNGAERFWMGYLGRYTRKRR